MAVILGSAVVIALMLRALAMDERPVALGEYSFFSMMFITTH